jgi:hypothetical protein
MLNVGYLAHSGSTPVDKSTSAKGGDESPHSKARSDERALPMGKTGLGKSRCLSTDFPAPMTLNKACTHIRGNPL